ncbi:unnamed protein product [Owenia fusiformis]|uniref:Uncharacterized protein n=1 Tax=Owenia fusiformis TaxID=6347 RepID=A0A8J1TI85_OWEFU|nr:unnamed protein product [Owenia fusiformis]
MADSDNDDDQWYPKSKRDEEMEFYTNLAVDEMQRWIEAVTRKKFSSPDDPRKSLENGTLLCELMNTLSPGAIKKINKLPTQMAYLDNLNMFIKACKDHLSISKGHLLDSSDLEDLSNRAIAESEFEFREENDRRIRNVAIAIFWIGKAAPDRGYSGPKLDTSAFSGLITDTNTHREKQLHNNESIDSAFSSFTKTAESPYTPDPYHIRDHSYDSHGSYDANYSESSGDIENMPSRKLGATVPHDFKYEYNGPRSPGSSSMGEDYHDGHKRSPGSSVSDDMVRTMPLRRDSAAKPPTNPLQFIAGHAAQEMAAQAQLMVKQAEIQKQKKTELVTTEGDWQNNLSSWKDKRRRKSSATLQRVEDTEVYKEEKSMRELADLPRRKSKTFAEMVEDRERRRSGLPSYPLEEEEENPITIRKSKLRNMNIYPSEDDDIFKKPAVPAIPDPEPSQVKPVPKVEAPRKTYSQRKAGEGRDMTINMSQRPNNNRGFGFTVSGGRDKGGAVLVEKVTLGSAADVCELQEGDEIISINGRDVDNQFLGPINFWIKESVKSGQLELKIKRFPQTDKTNDVVDEFSEEDTEEFPEDNNTDHEDSACDVTENLSQEAPRHTRSLRRDPVLRGDDRLLENITHDNTTEEFTKKLSVQSQRSNEDLVSRHNKLQNRETKDDTSWRRQPSESPPRQSKETTYKTPTKFSSQQTKPISPINQSESPSTHVDDSTPSRRSSNRFSASLKKFEQPEAEEPTASAPWRKSRVKSKIDENRNDTGNKNDNNSIDNDSILLRHPRGDNKENITPTAGEQQLYDPNTAAQSDSVITHTRKERVISRVPHNEHSVIDQSPTAKTTVTMTTTKTITEEDSSRKIPRDDPPVTYSQPTQSESLKSYNQEIPSPIYKKTIEQTAKIESPKISTPLEQPIRRQPDIQPLSIHIDPQEDYGVEATVQSEFIRAEPEIASPVRINRSSSERESTASPPPLPGSAPPPLPGAPPPSFSQMSQAPPTFQTPPSTSHQSQDVTITQHASLPYKTNITLKEDIDQSQVEDGLKTPPKAPSDDKVVLRQDSTVRIRKEILKRRSDFFGVDDSEESQTIEKAQVFKPPQRELEPLSWNMVDISIDGGSGSHSNNVSIQGNSMTPEQIEEQERQIIANIEREEIRKDAESGYAPRTSRGYDPAPIRGYDPSRMQYAPVQLPKQENYNSEPAKGQYTDTETVHSPVTSQVKSPHYEPEMYTPSNETTITTATVVTETQPGYHGNHVEGKVVSPSGRKSFSLEEDRQKMEEWNREQERKMQQPKENPKQEKFTQDQDRFRAKWEEDMRRVEEAEREMKEKEDEQLDKEWQKIKALEEKKKQRLLELKNKQEGKTEPAPVAAPVEEDEQAVWEREQKRLEEIRQQEQLRLQEEQRRIEEERLLEMDRQRKMVMEQKIEEQRQLAEDAHFQPKTASTPRSLEDETRREQAYLDEFIMASPEQTQYKYKEREEVPERRPLQQENVPERRPQQQQQHAYRTQEIEGRSYDPRYDQADSVTPQFTNKPSTYNTTVIKRQTIQASEPKIESNHIEPKHDNRPEYQSQGDIYDVRSETTNVIESQDRRQIMQSNRRPSGKIDNQSVSSQDSQQRKSVIQPREPISRKSLAGMSAVPKPKLKAEQSWVVPEDTRKKQEKERKSQRMSEIMRSENLNEHWMVQEAERRRLADQNERERLTKLQNRTALKPMDFSANQNKSPQISPNGGHREKPQPPQSSPPQGSPSPTQPRPQEYIERPRSDRQSRPIPDTIKQTLINRVNSPRNSVNYSDYQEMMRSEPNSLPGYGQRAPPAPAPGPEPNGHPGYSQHAAPASGPVKPPRLLADGSSGDTDSVISVSAKRMCSHCGTELVKYSQV